jgi:hypothetical protein
MKTAKYPGSKITRVFFKISENERTIQNQRCFMSPFMWSLFILDVVDNSASKTNFELVFRVISNKKWLKAWSFGGQKLGGVIRLRNSFQN